MSNKTFLLQFPEILFKADFIRGYFDGDGSVSITTKTNILQFNFIGTYDFLNSIQDILVKQGLNKIKIVKARKDSNIYTMVYGGINNCRTLYNFIYTESDLYIPQKKAVFDNYFKKHEERCQEKVNLQSVKAKQILDLYREGKSQREIAISLKVSRNTIRGILSI